MLYVGHLAQIELESNNDAGNLRICGTKVIKPIGT